MPGIGYHQGAGFSQDPDPIRLFFTDIQLCLPGWGCSAGEPAEGDPAAKVESSRKAPGKEYS